MLDKVKDLKECQEKHDFLKLLSMDLDDGRDSLEVIDDYIEQLDRELDDLMDADYSILPTEDTSQWVACDACTFVMPSLDDLKKHVANFHPKASCHIQYLFRCQLCIVLDEMCFFTGWVPLLRQSVFVGR